MINNEAFRKVLRKYIYVIFYTSLIFCANEALAKLVVGKKNERQWNVSHE